MALNVLGTELQPCSLEPLTGFFRDGCCNTNADDHGMHTVCVQVTDAFLEFSKSVGNDLSTPVPQYEFSVFRRTINDTAGSQGFCPKRMPARCY